MSLETWLTTRHCQTCSSFPSFVPGLRDVVRRLQFLRAVRRAALLLQVRNSAEGGRREGGDTRERRKGRSLLTAAKPRRSMDVKMAIRREGQEWLNFMKYLRNWVSERSGEFPWNHYFWKIILSFSSPFRRMSVGAIGLSRFRGGKMTWWYWSPRWIIIWRHPFDMSFPPSSSAATCASPSTQTSRRRTRNRAHPATTPAPMSTPRSTPM